MVSFLCTRIWLLSVEETRKSQSCRERRRVHYCYGDESPERQAVTSFHVPFGEPLSLVGGRPAG